MTVDGACDRQTLLLPARNVGTALRNAGIVLLLLFVDEFRRLRDVACAAHGVVVAVRISVRDVAGDRSLEQERLLRHVADLVAQRLQLVVAHVDAVDEHLALRGVVETRHEVDEGRFAGAGRADERDRLTLLRLEIDAFEHGVTRVGVGEAHIAEFDFAFLARLARVLRAVGDHRLGVDDFEHALRGHVGSRPEHEHHAQQQEAHDDLDGVAGEHHHVGEGGELVDGVGSVDEVRADPVDGEHQAVHDGVHQRHHDGHGAVGEQLGFGEFLVGFGELGFLVVLGVVRAHHAQAGEVLARHEVDVVGQALHGLELRHDEVHEHGDDHQQDGHGDAGCERPIEALSCDLAHGPHGHDRRFDDHHEAHGDEHLDLRDVVRGAGDERRGGETVHFRRSEAFHLVEFKRTQALAERGAHARGDEAGDDRAGRRSERDEQHFAAGHPDVMHFAAGGFDELRDVGHIIRQGQVKPDLTDDADQRDEHLTDLRFGEVSYDAKHAWFLLLFCVLLVFLRLVFAIFRGFCDYWIAITYTVNYLQRKILRVFLCVS